MNFEKLKDSLNCLVRLLPPADRRSSENSFSPTDDEWRLERVDKKQGIQLKNLRTSHVVTLNADHVHHFTSAPCETDGVPRGFLELCVTIRLDGDRATVEPILSGPARMLSRDNEIPRWG